MINIKGPSASEKVKSALKQLDVDGNLENLADFIEIDGGITALREIMNTPGDLQDFDMAILSDHLFD